jgi:hypothetical protein
VLALLIASSIVGSMAESEAWSSSRATIEKSLSRHPDRLSLKAYLITALNVELQWGRLTHKEINQLKALKNEINTRCGLTEGTLPPASIEDRDDCIWSWMETLLNPQTRGTPAFQRAASYLQESRSRLLPQRLEQLEARTEVIEASYGLRKQLNIEPSQLIAKSGYEVTPEGRVRLIAALCLTGHISEAKRLNSEYTDKLLINLHTISEVISSSGKETGKRAPEDLVIFKTLQSCFNLTRS